MKLKLEKLNHHTLAKQVVRAIRLQIFSGALEPGERVVEAEIADVMGISRGPVREAFAELEKEGLLTTYPRRGTYVKSFSLKDIEEIYTLRAIVEGYAVTRALDRLTEEDLTQLRGILDEISEMAGKKDVIEVARLNMQFHRKILELSDHRQLYATWESLLAQTQMLSAMTTEYYTSLPDIRKTHEILLDALTTRDKERNKRSFENHILVSMNELIDHLKKIQQEGPPKGTRKSKPSEIPEQISLTGKRRS